MQWKEVRIHLPLALRKKKAYTVSGKANTKNYLTDKIQGTKNKIFFLCIITFVTIPIFNYESFDSITLYYSCLPRS